MLGKLFRKEKKIIIESQAQLEDAALYYGMLPFFNNPIKGFSVAELAAPGMLFGGSEGYDGCWEWKGPVIQQQTTAYGKFFKRKAGFVALELFPDFLNYRRNRYPVSPDSTDEMILDIIRENDGLSSTELRKLINGSTFDFEGLPMVSKKGKRSNKNRQADKFGKGFEMESYASVPKLKRSSLEGPLQRLQMGGWLLITDFEYKQTKGGDRYGWGVARYSTPEIWFGNLPPTDRTPEESLDFLVKSLSSKLPWGNKKAIRKLLE